LDVLFASEVWPFGVAAGLLVVFAAVEGLALLIGASSSHWVDASMSGAGHVDIEQDGFLAAALGWLHIGKVPFLAIVVIFLSTFSASGFALQFGFMARLGFYLPAVAATAAAFVVATSSVRVFGGALGKLIPKDESSAVSDATLVGRIATVTIGNASPNNPAEARVYDEHGMAHYIMLEPEEADEVLSAGASVLLVRHVSGRRFRAIHNPKPGLL
jgi:hypothetical protein